MAKCETPKKTKKESKNMLECGRCGDRPKWLDEINMFFVHTPTGLIINFEWCDLCFEDMMRTCKLPGVWEEDGPPVKNEYMINKAFKDYWRDVLERKILALQQTIKDFDL